MRTYRTRAGAVSAVLALAAFLGLAALPAPAQDLRQMRQNMLEMLDRAADDIEKNFYDPKLKGLDWKALTEQTRQRVQQASTVNEMLTAIFLFVRQLDDSHTFLLPPRRVAEVLFGFEAKAYGEEVRIYKFKEESAGQAAGLELGDRIWAINGVRVTRENFDILWVALHHLLPVTAMDIVISRGSERPRLVRVEGKVKKRASVRDWREAETVWQYFREVEEAEEDFHYGRYSGATGYLQLPYFFGLQTDLRDLVNNVDDCRAFILDLRGNLGGSVDTAAYFAGFFDTQPTVMADLVGRKKTEPIKVKPHKPQLTGPLFILVDSQSSSAAEMVARHFQRSGRAVVIGDRTSGRLTASRLHFEEMAAGTVAFAVQVAEARVVFPGGEELEKRGVSPDQPCLPSAEDLRQKRDVCLDQAVALARKALGMPETTVEGKEPKKD